MRFSLRTFLLMVTLIGALMGWIGIRYQKKLTEQRLLSELEPSIGIYFVARSEPDDRLYERYSDDRLTELVEQYAATAMTQQSNLTAARIAAAALAHLGSRYDRTLAQFTYDPRAIPLAEQFVDVGIKPLSSVATWILLRRHRLSDDVHSSQYCEADFQNGFDPNEPIDVYVLATEVYSEFNFCDQEYDIEQNWPQPQHPWGWNLTESAKHSYQDKVDALQQVSPEAATAYAGIVRMMTECDAKPSDLQRQEIGELALAVMLNLTEETIFRFMLKNLSEFTSRPKLLLPPELTPQPR